MSDPIEKVEDFIMLVLLLAVAGFLIWTVPNFLKRTKDLFGEQGPIGKALAFKLPGTDAPPSTFTWKVYWDTFFSAFKPNTPGVDWQGNPLPAPAVPSNPDAEVTHEFDNDPGIADFIKSIRQKV